MSIKLPAILIVFGISFLACVTTTQAVVADPISVANFYAGPKTYAILVGSRAPSNGVADAIRGDLDVDRVAAQLSWANVKTLKYNWGDSNSVAGDIQSAASAIAAQLRPGDSFIFYYSGHGTGGSGLNEQDYLNPVQGPSYQDNTLTSVFSDSLFSSVKKFFLIDSCHSEGIWKNDIAGDRDLETLSNISFLASSSEDGMSYSDPANGGTSYFTNALLSALTPDATFGSLLMGAMAASGNDVTGYFKDDGYGTGKWQPVGYTSADFNPNIQLNGQVVPEPASLLLLLLGATSVFVWRRQIR